MCIGQLDDLKYNVPNSKALGLVIFEEKKKF